MNLLFFENIPADYIVKLGWVFVVAFSLTCVATKILLPYLHKLKFGQAIRLDGPQTHLKKQGTPTMGGVVFIPAIFISIFLVAPAILLLDRYSLSIAVVVFGYFIIGFIDDYLIVVKKVNDGLSIKAKLCLQTVTTVIFLILFIGLGEDASLTQVTIPLVNKVIDLGPFYPIFIFLMFIAITNAVNFTDGLDGLVSGTTIIVMIPICFIGLSMYVQSVPLFAIATIGSLLGFLVFNRQPAKLFMGDTGSLPIGALLATLFVILKVELLFFVIGGVYVMEFVSVVLQIGSYKLRNKKRIFKMAPIHHHFELSGWTEQKVIHVFWLIGVGCAVLGTLIYVLGGI